MARSQRKAGRLVGTDCIALHQEHRAHTTARQSGDDITALLGETLERQALSRSPCTSTVTDRRCQLTRPNISSENIADATGAPAQVSEVLRDLTAAVSILLGDNLIGIYLYGSLTQDAFNAERSDVDCIVVIRHELSDAQFAQLDRWLTDAAVRSRWVARLQISFLMRETILIDTLGGNCLYQFGRLSRV